MIHQKNKYHPAQQRSVYEIQKELMFRELSRRKISFFTQFTFPNYQATKFHTIYGSILDKFISGEIKKLIISMPPQHGKSELSTRRLPALFFATRLS